MHKTLIRMVFVGVVVTVTSGCFPKLPDEVDGVDGDMTADGAGFGDLNDLEVVPGDGAGADIGPTGVPCDSDRTCEGLAGVCQIARCVDRVCEVTLAAEGADCDDGNRCSADDVCTDGACVGTPRTCDAVSDCHLPGSCDPETGACSTPTRLDGSGCDDGNACTLVDTCRLGRCVGTGKPEIVDDVFVLARNDDGVVELGGLVATRSGTWTAIWSKGGVSELHHDDVRSSVLSDSDVPCGLSLLKWKPPNQVLTVVPFLRFPDVCTSRDGWSTGLLGMQVLPDDSFVLGGFTSGEIPLANGRSRPLGASPNGSMHASTYWLARFGLTGSLLWTLEFQGFLGAMSDPVEIPHRTLSANTDGKLAVAIPIRSSATPQLVGADDTLIEIPQVSGDLGSVLFNLDNVGTISTLATVTAAPGSAMVVALSLGDDNVIAMAGLADHVVSLKPVGGGEFQIPTGGGERRLEPWLMMLEPDGKMRWGWHIFSRSSFAGPTSGDIDTPMLLPAIVPGSSGLIWFMVLSNRPVDGRTGTGPVVPISMDWPDTGGFRTTLIGLDRESGALQRSVVLQAPMNVVTAATNYRGNPYVAGIASGQASHWNVFSPQAGERPFVAGIDRWFESVANSASFPHNSDFVNPGDIILQPLLSSSPQALFVAFEAERAFTTPHRGGPLTVNGAAVVVRQLNVNSALDCQ